jgi:Membrane magnesium transporter
VRGLLGVVGTVMLLHAGYSASESLAYEKSVDPSSPLQIPLDVWRAIYAGLSLDQSGNSGVGHAALSGSSARQRTNEACEMERMDKSARTRDARV